MSQRSTPGAIRRVLLIVNPKARRAEAAGLDAVRALVRANVACEVLFTQHPGHAEAIARDRAAKFDAVFTLGGDGTAMEVVSALAAGGPPVGVLPGGTGNVLVSALGIPMHISRAVPALLDGVVTPMDLGRLADGQHFAIGVGIGLDEAMIAGASTRMKKRLGVLAYVWSAAKAVVGFDHFHVRLTVDGTLHDAEAASVLILNVGSVLRGMIRFDPEMRTDDGFLHAFIFSPRHLGDALRIFTRMLRGTVRHDRCVTYARGKHMVVETTPPRRAQADGELLGVGPLDVTSQQHAARLLVPRPTGPRSS